MRCLWSHLSWQEEINTVWNGNGSSQDKLSDLWQETSPKPQWLDRTWVPVLLTANPPPQAHTALQGSLSPGWFCILCHTDVMLLHICMGIHAHQDRERKGETGDLAIKSIHPWVTLVTSIHILWLKPSHKVTPTLMRVRKQNSPISQNGERTRWTPIISAKKYSCRKRKTKTKNIKFFITSFLNLKEKKATFVTVKNLSLNFEKNVQSSVIS